jgi:hypothetical protein
MSTTGPFNTGYIGAHRWHVEQPRGTYIWTCTCGDTGRVAGNLSFTLHAFGEHAHRKLEQAALALLEGPHLALKGAMVLQGEVNWLRKQGEPDQANLLQMVVNHRYNDEND